MHLSEKYTVVYRLPVCTLHGLSVTIKNLLEILLLEPTLKVRPTDCTENSF